MEGHVQRPATSVPQTNKKCPTPERVEREGRQYLDAQRNLEENRCPESPSRESEKKKKQQYVNNSPPTTPGNRDGIWDDDGKENDDWISQTDEVEKAIQSPSGARFYRHEDQVSTGSHVGLNRPGEESRAMPSGYKRTRSHSRYIL
ncbi:hypothetical protein PG994_006689 [Apiospora phragmitis]|uniref:Uncharacterized protein n=1 Tax=Apiospora phragmitis TaxID=2905665 RepID=A0ABR1VFW0_9PEZI